jgi:hypothetical protein
MREEERNGYDFVAKLKENPAQLKLAEAADLMEPVNERAFASFIGVPRRRVEAWRREKGAAGEHYVKVGGDTVLTRKGAIQCAGEMGRGISVQNAVSFVYVKPQGHRVMMKGTCPNPRVVRAVKLSDGLLVVVRVRNPMEYPMGCEFTALDNGQGGYSAPGNFDRRGW